MIVPQFWAESRVKHREANKQVTVRRFGWSDVSTAEAQLNADARVKDALQRILSGEKLARRDPKIPYNGAAGVPIREEIVSRHGETIITRNSYGAKCLNTPNVLFADVDFPVRPSLRVMAVVHGTLIALAGVVAWTTSSLAVGVLVGLAALLVAQIVSGAAFRTLQSLQGGAEAVTRKRIMRFISTHPGWSARTYRTPAGMRIAVTHRPFSQTNPRSSHFSMRWRPTRFTWRCRERQWGPETVGSETVGSVLTETVGSVLTFI